MCKGTAIKGHIIVCMSDWWCHVHGTPYQDQASIDSRQISSTLRTASEQELRESLQLLIDTWYIPCIKDKLFVNNYNHNHYEKALKLLEKT